MESKSKSPLMCSPVDNKEIKHEDLLKFLNVFSSEFDNSSLHDRVLVFKVDKEEPEVEMFPNNGNSFNTTDESDDLTNIQPCTTQSTNNSFTSEKCSDKITQEEKENEGQNEESKIEEVNVVENDKKERSEEEKEEVEKEDVLVEEEEEEKEREEVQEKETRAGEEDKIGKENVSTKGYDSSPRDQDDVVPQQTLKDEQLNEHKIFVHSSWLAVQSSYFRALFYSGMKESHSKEVVMNIPESELQAHKTLIEAMYKLDILNNKDYRMVLQVLVLADRYDVNLVFKKCKYVLMDTPLTLESCECIVESVKDLSCCDDLLDTLKKFLVKEFTPLDKTWTEDKFIGLSEALLKLLLSSDDLAVQSENTVFVALMKWIKSNILKILLLMQSSLLSLVRFELMTAGFLYDVVRRHAIAKKMVGFNQFLHQGLGYHCFSQERRDFLNDKPVLRPSFNDKDPTLLWVIDKNVRDKLLLSPITGVSSSKFWYKGYQMFIEFSYEAESNMFGIYWHVVVQNMSNEGCLNLDCKAKSNLFNPVSIHHMYGNGIWNWGYKAVESKVSFSSVPQHESHTIEIWVEFI